MFPKCFNCSNNLSLSWFFGSFMRTKHRCVHCAALHEFTNWHKFYSVLFFVGITSIPSLLKGIISSYEIRFSLTSGVLLFVFSITPNQCRLSLNEDA